MPFALQVSTVLGSVLEEQRIHNEWIEGVAIWIAVIIVIFVGESYNKTPLQWCWLGYISRCAVHMHGTGTMPPE